MDFIKDADCTKETPVKLGVPDAPIYGKGIKLKPRVDGRTDSEHFKKIYLPELLPLEEYDLIVVLISGGKDSVACYLKLLELGVPKERIEFWHHDIDGGHPSRRMDWKCTQNYVKALADAEGIKLRVSYRVNGFFGELYRIGASEPIEWIDPDTGEVKQCKLSSNYLKCKELKEQATEEMEELLKKYGYRMKFPAKTGDLSRRWCSAYLKICVADAKGIIKKVHQAAVEAVESTKPVNVCFGKVISASPLQINVEQKMILTEKQLVLSRNVTDFKTKITAGNIKNYYYTGDVNSGTAPVSPSHVHAVGTIEVTVHNGLAVGDGVILIRQQEGQKFIVVDRIGK